MILSHLLRGRSAGVPGTSTGRSPLSVLPVFLVLLAVAVLPPALPAVGASQPPPAERPQEAAAAETDDATQREAAVGFTEEISVGWVLVPVLVRNRSGRFITDLGAPDFELSVDGEPVEIASFERGRDAPMSVVVLQDLSGSMANGGKLEAGRRALTYLVAGARARDELAVAAFAGGRLTVDIPFTTDREAVAEAMDRWRAYGTTALHDAVAWIPEISGEGRHPKRAVLLVTDGVDNASTIAPEEARQIVERAHLPVYVVGLGSANDAPVQPQADTYARLLKQLARVSGGRYFAAETPADVSRAVRAALEDLRHEYVLGFPSGEGERQFRRIEVDVDGSRHQALHRLGYSGGPPQD